MTTSQPAFKPPKVATKSHRRRRLYVDTSVTSTCMSTVGTTALNTTNESAVVKYTTTEAGATTEQIVRAVAPVTFLSVPVPVIDPAHCTRYHPVFEGVRALTGLPK